jgi:hypothetical protein
MSPNNNLMLRFCGRHNRNRRRTLKKTTGFSAWGAMAGKSTEKDSLAADAMVQDNRITDWSRNSKRHSEKKSGTTQTKPSKDSHQTTWEEKQWSKHSLFMRTQSALDAKLLRFKVFATLAVFALTLITAMSVNLTKITNMHSWKYVDLNKLHHTYCAIMKMES